MLQHQIILLIILILLSAFFSGIETALMTLSSLKVKTLFRKKVKGAETLRKIKSNPQKLIITILIGNNLVNISAASIATVVFTDIFGSSGLGYATGVMTFLILIFGEITPKTIATYNSMKISLAVAPIINFLEIALTPLVWFFEQLSGLITKVFAKKGEDPLSEDELRTIVTVGKDEGILSSEAAEMMHNLLEFEGTVAEEIMTPNTDVHMLSANEKMRDVLEAIVKSPYSRFPVYDNNKDNILGIVDVDDVLMAAKNKKLSSQVGKFVREVIFVPESKEIDDLLSEFENKKIPMAIIVDEYGGVSGLVTVEDILEEIVGDIFDKSKKSKELINKIQDKVFKVSGRTPLDELNKDLNLGLDEETHNYNTIAGYVEHVLQKIPKKGEIVKLKEATITVETVTRQGVKSLKIVKN